MLTVILTLWCIFSTITFLISLYLFDKAYNDYNIILKRMQDDYMQAIDALNRKHTPQDYSKKVHLELVK